MTSPGLTPKQIITALKSALKEGGILQEKYRELVRLILRNGWRLVLRSKAQIELRECESRPTEAVLEHIAALFPALVYRLRKPPGWPKDVPLPDWWSDIALGFKILQARRSSCACGFPVAVYVSLRNGCHWHCPSCGRQVDTGSELGGELRNGVP